MSTGPIEFLGEEAAGDLGHTEYGGGPGLIQPEIDPLGGEGHALTPSEGAGVLKRAGGVPLSGEAQLSGVVAETRVVDPVTGRVLEDADNQDVTNDGGEFSGLKPG